MDKKSSQFKRPNSVPCVITFYKNNEPHCNITTGDLSNTEIIDVLATLQRGFAKTMYKEAVKACGTTDLKVIGEYLDAQLNMERKDIDDLLSDISN